MPDHRKRPCCICRHWLRPDPQVGVRQRACRKAECQAARRQTQAAWRGRNPDYFIARRIQERAALPRRPEPLRLPPPLGQLPLDLAQDQFGVQETDLIGVRIPARVGRGNNDQEGERCRCVFSSPRLEARAGFEVTTEVNSPLVSASDASPSGPRAFDSGRPHTSKVTISRGQENLSHPTPLRDPRR